MKEVLIEASKEINEKISEPFISNFEGVEYSRNRKNPGFLKRLSVRIWVNLHVVFLAFQAYGSIRKTKDAVRQFKEFKKKAFGRNGRRKFSERNNQYWFGLYIPPFPSLNFDKYVLTEMNRYVPHSLPVNAYQQVNFAITTRCPMRCEHCFEWDNLNLHETFTLPHLQEIIGRLQKDGLGQISLSGGEPMVRFDDMIELITSGDKTTEWWILTSGFNLNFEKAHQLKNAGATGVVVSIDHYQEEVHNRFRGHRDAFAQATKAALAAGEAGLSVAVSVCVTRENANREFLLKHAGLASHLGADFVQWLEPRAVGHYHNKEVLLDAYQIDLMEKLYEELNHDPENLEFPPIIYHGYHQRRVGCLSGGKISFYVDAVGMVHSCPFCHSADFKITDWLEMPKIGGKEITACKLY